MSYKHLFLAIGIILVLAFVYFNIQQPGLKFSENNAAEVFLKVNGPTVFSPDKSKKLVVYSLDEQELDKIISVVELKGNLQKYVYIGRNIDFPKWLGNDHIFFTKHCGTSCQGLVLVDVLYGEVRGGLLSYMVLDAKKPDYTNFQTWFDQEFEFQGLPKEIIVESKDNQIWLVFKMVDENNRYLGERKLLFTGNDLQEL